jgi:hypothetical protein
LNAFIRKPEHGDLDDISPAARVARALAAVCISCSASILGPAAAAQAGTPAPRYSVSHPLTMIGPVQMPGPAEPGDHDPPHTEGPELTRDGSVPTYAVTAPTSSALSVRPPRWPTATFGLPDHSLLPPYSSAPGPHAAPTHLVAPPPTPGPHGPSAGPGLAQR